jgi:hypothetical protein
MLSTLITLKLSQRSKTKSAKPSLHKILTFDFGALKLSEWITKWSFYSQGLATTDFHFKTSRPTSRQLARQKPSCPMTPEQDEQTDDFSEDAVFETNES